MTRALGFLLLTLPAGAALASGDWNQFRGPAGTGVAGKARLPDEWSATNNLAWKQPIDGSGWSAPAVWKGRIYLTTAVGEKGSKVVGFDKGVKGTSFMGAFTGGGKAPDETFTWRLLCLDAETGKVAWQKEIARRKPAIPRHPSNTFATETPATDGERVYTFVGPLGLLTCHDAEGKKLLWSKELGTGKMTAGFGTGSSPALADGRVFVQRDHEGEGLVVAFDAKTGKELWRQKRKGGSSWSTPLVWRAKRRTDVVTAAAGALIAYDPATGKEVWRCKTRSSGTASPAADADVLVFGNSSPMTPGQLVAIKAGATGDVSLPAGKTSSEHVAWSVTGVGPGMASPVIVSGRLYVVTNDVLRGFDAATGEKLYQQRLPGAKTVAASLLAAGGRVYVLEESGTAYVLQEGPKYKLLARNRIDGLFWSTPALAGDALLLRSADALHCVRSK